MCESKVILQRDDGKETLMDEAVRIVFTPEKIIMEDILGVKKEIGNARIIEANLVNHEIVLEEI